MKRLGLLGGMSWESSVEYGATDQRAGTGADGRCRVSRSLIHIADVTAAAVRAERVTAVAVLVTRYTMEQDFYVRRLREMHGLTVLVPDEPDRTAVHNVIYDELVRGVTDGASRQRYLEVIARLQARGADGLIAACTEIELLIGPDDVEIPFFRTMHLHALAAVDFALGYNL